MDNSSSQVRRTATLTRHLTAGTSENDAVPNWMSNNGDDTSLTSSVEQMEKFISKLPNKIKDLDYNIAEHLCGPLNDKAKYPRGWIDVFFDFRKYQMKGENHVRIAEYQNEYGKEDGMAANIAIPSLSFGRDGPHDSGKRTFPAVFQEVVIANPDDAKRIARIHVKKQPNFTPMFFNSIISTTDEKDWKNQREQLVSAFLPKASLEKIFPVTLQRAKDCADRLERLRCESGDGSVNLNDFYLFETEAQLQLALFGMRPEFMEETNAKFRQSMGGLIEPGYARDFCDNLLKEMESEEISGPVTGKCPVAHGQASSSGKCPVAHGQATPSGKCPVAHGQASSSGKCPVAHGQAPSSGTCPMRNIQPPAQGQCPMRQLQASVPVRGPLSEAIRSADLSGKAKKGNAFIFAFAGHDTTGHTLTWLTFELAKNPTLQRRLQQEVDDFFVMLGGRDMAYEDLKNLPYMTRCIMETLRLWNPVPNGTFREIQFDDTIRGPNGKDVVIKKGTHCRIVNWSRHRNPDLWGPDANEFNPDRDWQPEELWNGDVLRGFNPATERFSPFTFPPRDCIGKNFAHMEMRAILCYLLKSYSFELTEEYKQSDPQKFMGVNYGTLGPQDLKLPDMMKAYPGWGPDVRRPLGMHFRPVPRRTASDQ